MSRVQTSSPLERTLLAVADLATQAADPWWIIGSAAVALHSGHADQVADVDLLMSAADAERVLGATGAERLDGKPSLRFRSAVFGVWRGAALPVDVMGDFSLFTGETWRPIRPLTRQGFAIAGQTLYAPAAGELRDILLAFGRPKDLARAERLRRGEQEDG